MSEQSEESFGQTAATLARNPLGIIALFIVLVYAIAGLVFAGFSQADERRILLYFLVGFPVLVMAVFLYLVVRHHDKLYGPWDFKNQKHFIELIEKRIASSPIVRRIDETVADLTKFERANVLVYQALGLFDQRNYPGALHYLDEALKIHPGHLIALVKKSACLKRMNDVPGALLIVEQTLTVDPKLEVALYNRACYRALLNYPKDQVLADLRRAIELFPDNKRYASADPDFAGLKTDTEFQKLIGEP